MPTHPLLEEVHAEAEVSVWRLTRPCLSTQAAQVVCEELSRLAGESGRWELSLDCGGVEYLAFDGLGRLLELDARLRAAGGGLRLCDAAGCLELDRLGGLRDGPQGPGQPA